MITKRGQYVTARSVKAAFLNQFPEINSISDTTIRGAMKGDLRMKYKKLSTIMPKTLDSAEVRSF